MADFRRPKFGSPRMCYPAQRANLMTPLPPFRTLPLAAVLALFACTSGVTWGQSTYSPYSRFGLGKLQSGAGIAQTGDGPNGSCLDRQEPPQHHESRRSGISFAHHFFKRPRSPIGAHHGRRLYHPGRIGRLDASGFCIEARRWQNRLHFWCSAAVSGGLQRESSSWRTA